MESFEAFAENVKNRILDFMPEEYKAASAEIKHVLKNNDEKRTGIRIWREGWTTAPILYLEGYYQMLREGDTETEIIERAAREYLNHDRKVPKNFEAPIPDFESVRERLWLRLAGKESNRKRLEGCVYKEVEGTDLVATFQLRMALPGIDGGAVDVDSQLLSVWGCDVDSLYGAALNNMVCQMPAQVMEMESVLMSVFTGREEPGKPEEVSCQPGKLYVLKNTKGLYGAAALLYPGVLQTLAENSGSDLFLLPSSVHEVLVIKVEGLNAKELQRIVIETNRSKLEPEDVLSDQVYRYDAKTQSLSCATTREETQELMGALGEVYGQPILPESDQEGLER